MDQQLTRKEIRNNRLSRLGRVSSMLIVFILINVLFRILLSVPNQIKTCGSLAIIHDSAPRSAWNNMVISVTVPVNHFISGFLVVKKIDFGNVMTFSITRQPTVIEIELQFRGFDLSAYTFHELTGKHTQISINITQNRRTVSNLKTDRGVKIGS